MAINRLETRMGFTIVEGLVVIAIVGLLFSIALPAINRARDLARRAVCRNNLHQIGTALHHYHTAHGRFPPGVTSPLSPEKKPWLGWSARILPFIERNDLWTQSEQAFQKSADFRADPPHPFSTVIPTYGCPSDARTLETGVGGRGGWFQIAFTSYLGNGGTDLWQNDGVLFMDSRAQINDINDGLSNTILVGERPPSPDNRFGWWYGGQGQNRDGNCDLVLGVRERNVMADDYSSCPKGPYHFVQGNLKNQCDMFHFWSTHFGGAHFLMCDGSVHFLSYSADPILPALATRSGNEAVELP